jgi:hypothetical protein
MRIWSLITDPVCSCSETDCLTHSEARLFTCLRNFLPKPLMNKVAIISWFRIKDTYKDSVMTLDLKFQIVG